MFAKIAATDGYNVLALDADINQHLAEAIGYNGEMRSMGTDGDVIKRYLHPDIAVELVHKTTPPSSNSPLIHLQENDWFIQEFTARYDGVWLAGAGEIPEGNVGVRCYHGLNGAVELVLGHLIDRQDDIILVDMTAGADAFSSSLFTKVDALVLVVEPTLKSLKVYRQFEKHAADYDVPIIVVGNKIQDAEDRRFVLEHVPDVAVWIEPSDYVKARERGKVGIAIEERTVQALRKLREQLINTPIDWKKRERLADRMHRRAVDVPMIDPDFSLEAAAL